MGIKLDKHQMKAVTSIVAEENKLCLITGGGGRGKSTIVSVAVSELVKLGVPQEEIFFAAPTGKAAIVLDSMIPTMFTNRPSTIHSLFGCQGFQWAYDCDGSFDAQYLFVDESSMVGSLLMRRVFTTVSEHCKIILLGDAGQLHPVEAGCPFIDIINTNASFVNKLVTNYRQKNGELLADVCERIAEGKQPVFSGERYTNINAFHNIQDDKEDIPAVVLETIKDWYDNGEDWVCLSPQRTGVCGLNNLNEYLQQELNPPETDKLGNEIGSLKVYGYRIRVGDRVRQTKNNYKLGESGVMNGAIGTVMSILGEHSLEVEFDGELVPIEGKAQIQHLVLAYAVTVHSSQGSQYSKVCFVLHSSHTYMINRSLIYVAVSRAREELHIIGDAKALKKGISKNVVNSRNTYLGLRIKGEIERLGDEV